MSEINKFEQVIMVGQAAPAQSGQVGAGRAGAGKVLFGTAYYEKAEMEGDLVL